MSNATAPEPDESSAATKPPLKLKTPILSPENPWSDDALGREKVAVALTNLVKPETNPLVITLNGGWGTGKTFFLKRWEKTLEKDGLQAIYFNAWEDDSCGDPLVAIIGQLCEHFTEKKYEKTIDTIIQAAKKVTSKLAFKSAGALTCGFLNLTPDEITSGKKVLDNILGSLAEVQAGAQDTVRERLFDEYQESHASRNELRDGLTALTGQIRKGSEGPLVFIIDELDRCRPTSRLSY